MPEQQEYEVELVLNEQGMAIATTPLIKGYLELVFIEQTMPARVVIRSERYTNNTILDGFFRLSEYAYPRSKGLHRDSKYIDHYATRHLLNEAVSIRVIGARAQTTKILLRWVTVS